MRNINELYEYALHSTFYDECKSFNLIMFADKTPNIYEQFQTKAGIFEVTSKTDVTDDEEREQGLFYLSVEFEKIKENN